MTTATMPDRPVVFYDGGCPLCRREIAHYQRLDTLNRVEWVDIVAQPERLAPYNVAWERAMQRFHLLDVNGQMHSGAYAFAVLWRQLPYYRILAHLLALPGILPLLDKLYTPFARWRWQRRCPESCKLPGSAQVLNNTLPQTLRTDALKETHTIRLRSAGVTDLPDINAVIDAAVMTWALPERVKRLALPSYHYQEHDLKFLELLIAADTQENILAVAGFETADPADTPAGSHTLLLHGIYVLPARQRQGTGSLVLQAVEDAARERGYDRVLVKAQPDAEAFFIAQGYTALPIIDIGRDYPHRFLKKIE